jgi:hypothetical protein
MEMYVQLSPLTWQFWINIQLAFVGGGLNKFILLSDQPNITFIPYKSKSEVVLVFK